MDKAARERMADPDAVRSIFFLGFEVDEQLDDRLVYLRRLGTDGKAPAEALELPLPLGAEFDGAKLEAVLVGSSCEPFKKEPGGRQLKGAPPAEPQVVVRRLVAALVPLTDTYPLPHFRVAT